MTPDIYSNTNETEESIKINKEYSKAHTDYFFKQLEKTYRSTEKFFDFLDENNLITENTSLIDACCGCGVNSIYVKKRFKSHNIIGFDSQKKFIDIGLEYLKKNYKDQNNLNLQHLDLFNLTEEILYSKRDGVFCMQTLMLFGDWRSFLLNLSKINCDWIALSSLFYEGKIEVKQEFSELDDNGISQFNSTYTILSIPVVENYLKEIGFKKIKWREFEIDIDLQRGDINHIGTYTIPTIDGKRMQKSGPMSMPWWFLIAEK